MRIEILGTPLDILSFVESVSAAEASMRQRQMLRQVSLNVAKLVNMRSDATLRNDVLSSSLISADGMGVVLAGRLLGLRPFERVAGIDLMFAVLSLCEREGFRPYFLGASKPVVRMAARAAVKQFPRLVLAGCRDGYFAEDEESVVVADIRASDADCLFVALPSPMKEAFIRRHCVALGVPFIMGVGGSLDVLSGVKKRAPLWVQKIGMEWACRLLQDPRRLGWRYIRTNAIFFALLLKELILRRVSRTQVNEVAS